MSIRWLRTGSIVLLVASLEIWCQAHTESPASMPPPAGLPDPVYPEVLGERPDLPSPVTTADGVELITGYFDEQGGPA